MEKAFIGDYLGTIEEFMPGKGTYTEDGKIYASIIGEVIVNKEQHTLELKGKILPGIAVGQVVYGEVIAISKSMINVLVTRISGFKNSINQKAAIYVSNISDSFVERPEEMFGIGDIVKARVIKVSNGLVDISTKGNLGVVKAFCKKCRGEMVLSKKFRGKLECTLCNSRDERKIALEYGRVINL